MSNPDTSIETTLRQTLDESHAGTASFGQIVMALAQVGVESYLADYRTGLTTYYLPDGRTFALQMPMHSSGVADTFDAAGVIAAIRGAQAGTVKYPQFKELTMAAGCVGYFVWIAGRHVSYFGRKGEVHIERFPD